MNKNPENDYERMLLQKALQENADAGYPHGRIFGGLPSILESGEYKNGPKFLFGGRLGELLTGSDDNWNNFVSQINNRENKVSNTPSAGELATRSEIPQQSRFQPQSSAHNEEAAHPQKQSNVSDGYWERYASSLEKNEQNFFENFYDGATDWARDTGYFVGGRFFVPATKGLYDPDLYEEFERRNELSSRILNYGLDNSEKFALKAVERMAQNPGYTFGRLGAGYAAGKFALGKTGYGPVGGSPLGITLSTAGQIDRFAQSLLSGQYDSSLVVGPFEKDLILGYFEQEGYHTEIIENEDGSSTFVASRADDSDSEDEIYSVKINLE